MALSLALTLRNSRLDAITTFAGGAPIIRLYSGTRPATGGLETTILAECVCSATMAPAASGQVLTFNAVGNDTSANATGTATWGRLVKSDGTTFVLDFSVSTTGSDMNMTTTSITAGQPVAISSVTITEANA
jgi:hypothetical protein